MSRIRKLAQGRACTIRLPGICDGGGETTVLAHLRVRGSGGMGIKPPDIPYGAFACHNCHSAIDGRTKPPAGVTKTDLILAHALGCLETLRQLDLEGEL